MRSVFFLLAAMAVTLARGGGLETADVARRIVRQLLSTEVDAYRPEGYAGNDGYPEGRPGQFVHYSVAILWTYALECARLTGDRDLERRLIARLDPFFGEKSGELPTRRHVDHYVFGSVPLEVYLLSGDRKALDLGLRYADGQWEEPKAGGKSAGREWWLRGYSPQTRLWIDDVYMISLLQLQAYRATCDRKYLDRAAKETALYLDRLQLESGLFNHAEGVPFVWGRGDGWMAAGMANVLRHLPYAHEARARIMSGYQKMMSSLLGCQREDGLWGQVVDDPGAWTESSASAMFAYAFTVGVKRGWLPEKPYAEAAERAWTALCGRLDGYANLAQTCPGTVARANRDHYLQRPRVNGDPHGQAALLWICAARLSGDEPIRIPLQEPHSDLTRGMPELVNRKADGFRGIWYYNQKLNSEYAFKYSGGMATYCAGHVPFAVYSKEADKTFFCFGGTDEFNTTLHHCVSYFDHKTGLVARPTIVIDKHATDAHDNAVLSLDGKGHLYLFSSSHGKTRPSCISRSVRPYDISEFKIVWNGNFSYPQPWRCKDRGFLMLDTVYRTDAGKWLRDNCLSTCVTDGAEWSQPRQFAFIDDGDYLRSWQFAGGKVGVAFDRHPSDKGKKGLNWRTDLYYAETDDFGRTWKNAAGEEVWLPIVTRENGALVFKYAEKGLNVYVKGVRFDRQGRPVILYVTSGGYECGPKNDPRAWMIARWTGTAWESVDTGIRSDNNYDFGVVYVDTDRDWRILGATEKGPQPYNPGGEIAVWASHDGGSTWKMERQLTRGSARNQNYARQPLNVHPDFYAFWADGHGRRPSVSRLYFCDSKMRVYRLPLFFEGDFARPEGM